MAVPSMPAAGALSCPSCGATVTAANKFCPSCGAALGPAAPSAPMAPSPPSNGPAPVGSGPSMPPPPPPPGPPPVDIRQRVDQDRGILKRVQLLIPGFHGYRVGEDNREADSILRLQIADKLRNAMNVLESARSQMANAGQFQAMTDLAPVLASLNQLEGRIRHAEQGYTGISPALRIRPEQQDRLYEYDYGFAQAADQVTQATSALGAAATGGDSAGITQGVTQLRTQVQQLDVAFRARIQVVEQVRVA
jgi:hypothetical protein